MIETPQQRMNGISSLQIGNQGSEINITVSVSLVPYSQIGFNTGDHLPQQSMPFPTILLVKDVKNHIHHHHARGLKNVDETDLYYVFIFSFYIGNKRSLTKIKHR